MPGLYQAALCVNTDDPGAALIAVPVSLDVQLPAQLQVAHLAPVDDQGSAVDIALNGDVVLPGVVYGASTGYLDVPAGIYEIEILAAGTSTVLLTVSGVELDPGVAYSALARGDNDNQSLGLTLLVDDTDAPAAGEFKLRLGHLAPFAGGAASAEVRLSNGTLLEEVDFGDVTGFLELAAGTYDLQITAPGGSPVLIDPLPVTFEEGDVISAFAAGDGSNVDLGVFALPPGVEGFFLPLFDPAELAVSPTELAFGDVSIAGAATLDFTVSNAAGTNGSSLVLASLDLTGDAEFEITGGSCMVGTELAPGEDCTVAVTFDPTAVDSFSAGIEIVSEDGQTATVDLSGAGVDQDPAELAVSPAALAFGEVGENNTATLDITVSNAADAGASALVLSALDISGDSEFAISGGDCALGSELEAGASCVVEVSFTPSAVANFDGEVVIAATNGDSETVLLSGEGVQLPDLLFQDRFEEED